MNRAPSALRRQQSAFVAALASPLPAGLLLPGPAGQAPAIAVYAQACRLRLVAALRDNFEVLALAMGDQAFDRLALAYLAAQPSRQASIRWFGHRLAAFMDQCLAADEQGIAGPCAGLVAHPALADLARMDWALRDAFDAADARPIGRDALAALPPQAWPALRLQMHPSVQLLALQWAVEPAWRALRDARDMPTDASPGLAAPLAWPHDLLVWREGLDTRWRSLDPAEARLLRAVAGGKAFAGLCEMADKVGDDLAVPGAAALASPPSPVLDRVVGALQRWLADGLLSALRV